MDASGKYVIMFETKRDTKIEDGQAAERNLPPSTADMSAHVVPSAGRRNCLLHHARCRLSVPHPQVQPRQGRCRRRSTLHSTDTLQGGYRSGKVAARCMKLIRQGRLRRQQRNVRFGLQPRVVLNVEWCGFRHVQDEAVQVHVARKIGIRTLFTSYVYVQNVEPAVIQEKNIRKSDDIRDATAGGIIWDMYVSG